MSDRPDLDREQLARLRGRHLRPLAALQLATVRFRVASAPLLEEERDALRLAEIVQLDYPRLIERPMLMPGLASGDQPIDLREVETFKRAEQRLGGEEVA